MTEYLPDDWPTVAAVVAALVVVVNVSLRVVALGIIPGNRKPSTGMAWLLIILLAPLLGFAAFLLFGSTRVGRKRHLKQKEVNAAITSRIDAAGLPEESVAGPAYLTSVTALNRRLGALPVVGGNKVALLSDYSSSIAAMTEAVGKAQHHVHVEFYICAWDELTGPLFEELAQAADRGVEVRLLFDHLGSKAIPGYKEMVERLRGTGVQWRPMLPIEPLHGRFRRPDLRNHRKLLVVDGLVGFTGSQNLTEPGYNKPKNHKLGRKWVELMCRLEGPVVTALEAVFAGDWYAETDERLRVEAVAQVFAHGVPAQLVPSGPGFVTENNLRMFNTLLYSAQQRISLTSPYFVPDESLLYAVTTAAQRGVAVELFVSEQSDQFMVGHAQASYYRALLEAGVEIYLYPPPFVLHSKHFTIDDDVAVLGSSNMDMRSFALNYELSLMLVGSEVVQRMREVEDDYRSRSRRLTLEEWGERSPRLRYVDNVMRLTAALQ